MIMMIMIFTVMIMILIDFDDIFTLFVFVMIDMIDIIGMAIINMSVTVYVYESIYVHNGDDDVIIDQLIIFQMKIINSPKSIYGI